MSNPSASWTLAVDNMTHALCACTLFGDRQPPPAQKRTCSTIHARSLRVERVLPAAMVPAVSHTHTNTDTLTWRGKKDKATSVISLQDLRPPRRPQPRPPSYPASSGRFLKTGITIETIQTTQQKVITQLNRDRQVEAVDAAVRQHNFSFKCDNKLPNKQTKNSPIKATAEPGRSARDSVMFAVTKDACLSLAYPVRGSVFSSAAAAAAD